MSLGLLEFELKYIILGGGDCHLTMSVIQREQSHINY